MLKKINLRSLLANPWALLLLAVFVAGGLTFLLYKYLNDRETRLKADIAAQTVRSGVQVVVPAHDLPAGTPLSSSEFVAREIPNDLAYDDMIRPDGFEKYRAARLVKAVRRGLPLRAADIDSLRGRDFSDALPAGQRALTVEIDTVNSTAMLLRPGNRVDLYWVGKVFREDHTSDDKKVAQLLMPDVLVLATGQDMRARDAGEAAQQDPTNANSSAMSRQQGIGYTTVTLQVPVGDVARIALAQRIGGLRLILRNADDKGNDGPPLVNESDVFVDPTRGTPASAKGFTTQVVEMISGGGSNGSSVLMRSAPQSAPAQPARVADAPAPTVEPAETAETAQRAPDLYEQANAVAQQLQKNVAPSTFK